MNFNRLSKVIISFINLPRSYHRRMMRLISQPIMILYLRLRLLVLNFLPLLPPHHHSHKNILGEYLSAFFFFFFFDKLHSYLFILFQFFFFCKQINNSRPSLRHQLPQLPGEEERYKLYPILSSNRRARMARRDLSVAKKSLPILKYVF